MDYLSALLLSDLGIDLDLFLSLGKPHFLLVKCFKAFLLAKSL